MSRISIIIPVYKVEVYIQRCLESVLSQTWNLEDAEIECILVDDCTPDNSMQIAQSMIKAYKGPIHFNCLKHEINKGLSAARNTGTTQATGDYVLYIDSDDYIAPKSLQLFIHYLKEYPNVDVIMGQVIQKPSNHYYSKKTDHPQLFTGYPNILRHFFHEDFFMSAWNKLTKRIILEKNRIHFAEGKIFEDISWMYQLFSNVNSVLTIPDTTYYYLANPSGIISTLRSKKNLNKTIESYLFMINYLLQNPPRYNNFKNNIIIDYLFYIHKRMTQCQYMIVTNDCSQELVRQFCVQRSRFVEFVFKKGRLLMIPYLWLLYKPICYLLIYSQYRKKYFYLSKYCRKILHITDILH